MVKQKLTKSRQLITKNLNLDMLKLNYRWLIAPKKLLKAVLKGG